MAGEYYFAPPSNVVALLRFGLPEVRLGIADGGCSTGGARQDARDTSEGGDPWTERFDAVAAWRSPP
jgi:hypothetical protein